MLATSVLAGLTVIALFAVAVNTLMESDPKAALWMWLSGSFASCTAGSAFHHGFMLAGIVGTLATFLFIGLSIYMLIELVCNYKTAPPSAV